MAVSEQASMDAAVRYVVSKYSPKGNWVGWLMMASILVEAWDLYSIAFVLVFIREQYHPEPLLLGLAAAGTQGGAVIGALLGGWLVVVRFILGVPLGSDISTGYTYIMESMPKGDREVMGNRWQFVFAVGEVLTLAVIALFIVSRMPSEWIWRLALALGAVPAAVILFLRHDLPETAIW